MKSTVEPVEDSSVTSSSVKLVVEVEEAEFEKALDAAFRKIAHEVRIPGFRPGKVPRRILEARVGSEYARGQALQESLPDFYVRALAENNVDAISSPELKLTSGEDAGPVAFEAVVEVRPTVRVPGYEGLQVTIPSPLASEDEITGQVDRMRGAFATLSEVDRPARVGDNVRIDVAGTHNGESVPGLTAEDYVYEVGANTVVAELDENLTGAKTGDELTFDAAVPGDDAAESGTIQLVVNIKAVNEKVLPEPNDEWAASSSEFTTIADLRGDIAKRMNMVKRVQANMAMRDEVIKALVELVDSEVPETLVNQEIERRMQELVNRLAQQGASLDMYLEATGQSQQDLIDGAREGADDAVKADLALRSVAESESVEVTDEDIATEVDNLARRFNMKPKQVRTNLERNYQLPVLKADIRKAKALTWLAEHATVVDLDGKPIERSLLEMKPSDLEEAGEHADALGLESSVDLDDDHDDLDDHAVHAGHAGHDHSGHDHTGHSH